VEGEEESEKQHEPHRTRSPTCDIDDGNGWKEKKKAKNNMHLIARDRLPVTQESLSSEAAAAGGEWGREKKKKWVGHVLTMEQQRSSGPRPL
jgi:hypothetical protein